VVETGLKPVSTHVINCGSFMVVFKLNFFVRTRVFGVADEGW